jgi:acyl-CoA thioesterase
MTRMDAQALAERCASVVWEQDRVARQLGVTIEHVGAGTARLSLVVANSMTNCHGTCHGGHIFTLADSAFALACNSYNQRAVAQFCTIAFIAPAYVDDRLVATAKEVSRRGRSGIYDIAIANQKGEPIAEFRGHSRTVKGVHLPGSESGASEYGSED